ncbi:MAG: nucleotidyltransferase family protein [Vulcanisaeta sp.]|jgi:predicted nucleotidyltransferase|uniref:nucleotidyltransferase family protein n=1 Tax=Vulcanisaeta sp. TaxID=2020871 RepID=UPI003D111F39
MEPIRRIELLRDWRSLINMVLPILRRYGIECYVFGSVVTGRITGSSDIDILLVIESGDPLDIKVRIAEEIEDRFGELAYLFDIKVVNARDRDKPPYTWFLRSAVRIF